MVKAIISDASDTPYPISLINLTSFYKNIVTVVLVLRRETELTTASVDSSISLFSIVKLVNTVTVFCLEHAV